MPGRYRSVELRSVKISAVIEDRRRGEGGNLSFHALPYHENALDAMHPPGIVLHSSAILTLGRRDYLVKSGHTGRVRCEPGWRLKPEWSPQLKDFDLWMVWEGRGELTTSEGVVPLYPGTVIWMRPGRRYEATQDPVHRLGVNFIHFELLTVTGAMPEARPQACFERMETRHVEFVDAVMRRIIELTTTGDASGSGDRLLASVLFELSREQSAVASGSMGGLTRHHRDVVHRIAHRIRERPGEVTSVGSLASEAGYSVDHFSRVFTEVMGQRPQRFLIEARLERARQLLLESAFTVSEVASAVGFASVHFFSRQFTQHKGVTPSTYRRQLRP